jgi:hypothetical protein
MRSLVCILGILSALSVTATGRAAETNLLHNGDIELPARNLLPPGWAIWGSSKYKVQENFIRDATAPHGGQACFRIHHPAQSEGYVVTAPANAVRAQAGKKYTLSFWARAARPGQAAAGLMAYKDIGRFVDAPWPGISSIDVDVQWKPYTLSFNEGCDFFAEESRYLMAYFKATSQKKEEQTLWIDDVALTAGPAIGPRLLNPATLVYPPLEHRLAPGGELVLQVDARRTLHPLVPEVCGISCHRIAGWTGVPYDAAGRYVLSAGLEEAIADLHLPMTRFYGLGVERFGLEEAIDRAAEFCRRIGVPPSTTPLEFENQDANSVLSPEAWVRGVRHALARGFGFHHWEITNEPYCAQKGPLARSPEAYLEHFVAVSRAIRQADPAGRIGINIENDPLRRRSGFGNYLLKSAAGHYDFVAAHHYCSMPLAKMSFEDATLTGNYRTLDSVQRINALLRAYNPGRDVYQYDTEWGMMGHGARGEVPERCVRNSNIFGMVHRAVRLIYYTREQLLRGASAWEMFTLPRDPGFSFLSAAVPERRAMNYWLYYYFRRHLGPTVLDLRGTAPYHEGTYAERVYRGPLTPAVVTVSADSRRLYAVVANGSWDRSVPCRIELSNFSPSKASGVVLSHSDPDGSPFLQRKEDLVGDLAVHLDGPRLTAALPPHSVTFIMLETAM